MSSRIANRIEAIVISVFTRLVSFNLEETKLRNRNEMQFEAVSYEVEVFWWFWVPIPYIVETVDRAVEISPEINLLSATSQHSQFMPSDLSEGSVASIEDSLSNRVDEAITQEVGSLKEHIRQIKRELNGNVLDLTDRSFRRLVSEITDKALNRYKQGLLVQLENAIRDARFGLEAGFRSKIHDIKGRGGGPQLTKPKCRMQHTLENGKKIVVVEEPPQARSVLFTESVIRGHSGSYSGKNRYRLAFPYVIFVQCWAGGSIESLFVFFSDSPVQFLDEKLCPASLPNLHGDSSMCTGGWINDYDSDSSLQDKAHQLVSGFWNSRFNSDLTSHLENAASHNSVLRSFEDWEEASEDGPEFMLDLEWWSPDYHVSIQDIINDRENSPGYASDPVESAVGGFIDSIRSEIKDEFRNRFDRIESPDSNEVPFSLETELKDGLQSIVDRVVQEVTNELSRFECDLNFDGETEHRLRRLVAAEITEKLDTSARVIPEDDAAYLSH